MTSITFVTRQVWKQHINTEQLLHGISAFAKVQFCKLVEIELKICDQRVHVY
jgi:hypothetical protein